jgi:hypothetical protein
MHSFLGGVRLCVLASRIWLDSAETEHIDPAVEARYDDGIPVVPPSSVPFDRGNPIP